MSSTFSRTLRSLRAERSRVTVTLLVVVLLVFAGWAVWLAAGEVALYEISETARLEARGAVHPVAAERAGRVTRVEVQVGQRVTAGAVHFELAAEGEELAVAEASERQRDLETRLAALEAQLSTERKALEADRKAGGSAADEARAWGHEVQSRASRAEERMATLEELAERGLATREEVREARAEHASADAEARARQVQARRYERESSVRVADRETRIAELGRVKAELQGEARVVAATVERLRHQLEATRVRAPVSGRVGELGDVRIGSVVAAGQVLARIIPEGEVHVVAYFDPTSAGRLHPDQPARLRFPGYSWTQFGTIAARVQTVSQEPANGLLRVELSLANDHPTPIPLTHSLPAVVEVEVERVSPLELLLRAAGRWVEGR
jgi:membrane fusion protein, adhesin transport system